MGTLRTLETTLGTDLDLGTDAATGPFNIARFARASFQMIFTYTGLEDSAGAIDLQVSNDGTTFTNYPSSTVNYTDASTSAIIELSVISFKFVRFNINNTSGTGGTVTILGNFVEITD
jgi:hypothetical protein